MYKKVSKVYELFKKKEEQSFLTTPLNDMKGKNTT